MRVEIVPAEASHALAMVGRFRPADIAELWAVAHRSPEACILDGLQRSPMAWTALFDGVPVAVFGVSTGAMLSGIGHPWMVGTTDLDSHGYLLVKRGRPMVAQMRSLFGHLVNFVDARNTKAIGWLKRMGFQFHEAQPHGADGLPFYRFSMGGQHV